MSRSSLVLVCGIGITCASQLFASDLVVKIGSVAPISGPQAHFGKDNENGVRMAIDDLNAKSVLIGGNKVRFQIFAEDDAADPKQGTAVAQKLCDAKVNGVVGHLNSGTSIPASRIYSECDIPNITPSATNPKLTQNGYKTTFRILANDNALGEGVIRYAAETLNLKRIALIDDRSAYGAGMAAVIKRAATASGIKIVDEAFTTEKAYDFMSIITAIKSKAPDGIFYAGFDAQAGPMLRQMEQLGLSNVVFMGGDGVCTEKIIELSAGAKTLNNVVCAEGGASLAKMPGGTAWKARYDVKFPNQFQVYSPYAYDATMVLVDAMVRAKSADPKIYLPFLAKTNYSGVTTKVAFNPDGELKSPSITLYQYKDGKKIPLN